MGTHIFCSSMIRKVDRFNLYHKLLLHVVRILEIESNTAKLKTLFVDQFVAIINYLTTWLSVEDILNVIYAISILCNGF